VPPQPEAEDQAEGLPLIPVGGVPSRQALGVHVRAIHLVLEDHKNDIIYNQQHVDENTVAINKINTKHVVLVNKHNHLVANQNQIDREQVAQKSRMKNLATLAIKNKKRSKTTARKCRNLVAVIKDMKQKMTTMAEYIDDQDHMLTEARLQINTLATAMKDMEKATSASQSRDGALLVMMMAKMENYEDVLRAIREQARMQQAEFQTTFGQFLNVKNGQVNDGIQELFASLRQRMNTVMMGSQSMSYWCFYKLLQGQVVSQGDRLIEGPPTMGRLFPPPVSAMDHIEEKLAHFLRNISEHGMVLGDLLCML
jgi:hypothetical protein